MPDAVSRLLLKISTDTAGARQDMKGLTDGLGLLFNRFTITAAAVVAAVGGITKLSKEWAEAGEQITILSQKTGFSAEKLSILKFAAERSGASIGNVEMASRTLSRTLVDAASGSGEAANALFRVGLSADTLFKMSPEEMFNAVAKAISGLGDQASKVEAVISLFGRSGTDLLPMLNKLGEYSDKARRLGLVFSAQDAENATKMAEAYQDIGSAMKGLGYAIGQKMQVREVLEGVTDVITGWAGFVKTGFPSNLGGVSGMVTGEQDLLGLLGQTLPDIFKQNEGLKEQLNIQMYIGNKLASNLEIQAAQAVEIARQTEAWLRLRDEMVYPEEYYSQRAREIQNANWAGGYVPGYASIYGGAYERFLSMYPSYDPAHQMNTPPPSGVGMIGNEGAPAAPGVGMFASGGIIDRPTLAMLGEQGPEAVVPMDGGVPIETVVNLEVILDGDKVARAVSKRQGKMYLRRQRMGG